MRKKRKKYTENAEEYLEFLMERGMESYQLFN
jgi:hypothetical protein